MAVGEKGDPVPRRSWTLGYSILRDINNQRLDRRQSSCPMKMLRGIFTLELPHLWAQIYEHGSNPEFFNVRSIWPQTVCCERIHCLMSHDPKQREAAIIKGALLIALDFQTHELTINVVEAASMAKG